MFTTNKAWPFKQYVCLFSDGCDDHGDDNLVPEPVPDLETTQVVQDTTNNIGDILDNDHQVIPGPSGTGGAVQVCQLSDDAK